MQVLQQQNSKLQADHPRQIEKLGQGFEAEANMLKDSLIGLEKEKKVAEAQFQANRQFLDRVEKELGSEAAERWPPAGIRRTRAEEANRVDQSAGEDRREAGAGAREAREAHSGGKGRVGQGRTASRQGAQER